MVDPHPPDALSTAAWWGVRRRRYNLALLVAGILAFAGYITALEVRCADVPEAEVTLFTIAVQATAYLLAMGAANLCFNFGPALERWVPPGFQMRYRQWAFTGGLAFSVALPFLVPLAILARGCTPGPA